MSDLARTRSRRAIATLIAALACASLACARDSASQTCAPEPAATACARLGLQCGRAEAKDACGDPIALDCGDCAAGWTCGLAKENVCGCRPEGNQEFCARLASDQRCGAVRANDNCGIEREVECGGCLPPWTCGGGGEPGVCGCSAQTDSELCRGFGVECGQLSVADRCGTSRTVDCGACGASMLCGAGGVAGKCGCASGPDQVLCAIAGLECGAATITDACGSARHLECGKCAPGWVCGGGARANACACAPESDDAFCARLDADCGPLSDFDNCAQRRTIDCGACPNGAACGDGLRPNVCASGCESDRRFCRRIGAACGLVAAPDACGTPRTVDCGTCAAPQACGAGGVANVCGCQSPPVTCANRGLECGPAQVEDACGRLVSLDCGGCPSSKVCGAGGVVNRCADPVCTAGGWCWENPLPAGIEIDSIHGKSGSDLWVAGGGGNILHFDGQAWRVVPSPTTNPLVAVLELGPDDVWFLAATLPYAGAYYSGPTTALHLKNGIWSSQRVSDDLLYTLSATGANDLWAAGYSTSVAHWNGSAWSTTTVGSEVLWTVQAFGPSDVWVGGPDASRWDGTTWTTPPDWEQVPPGWLDVIQIYGFGPSDVWVGRGSVVAHWDGADWASTWLDEENELCGTSSSDLWDVGQTHFACPMSSGYCAALVNLHHFDGARWSTVTSLPGYPTAVWSASPGDVWIASVTYYDAELMRWHNGRLERPSPLPRSQILSVAGSSANDLWAYDDGLYRRESGVWRPQPSPRPGNRVLWSPAPNELWAVGESVEHWDGATWTERVPAAGGATPTWYGAVSGSPATGIWIVGSAGAIVRCASSGCAAQASPTTADLSAVVAVSATEVLVGGRNGIWRWDGNQWQQQSLPTRAGQTDWTIQRLRAIGGEVLALGFDSNAGVFLLRRSSGGWTETSLSSVAGGSPSWADLCGRSVDDLWVMLGMLKPLHWDGSTWSTVDVGSTQRFYACWTKPGEDVWVFGSSGTILRRGQ